MIFNTPTAASAPLTRTERLLLVLVLLLATVLRLTGLGTQPLWIDEGFTYQYSRLPLATLASVTGDLHPPLFYLVEKFTLGFGESEFLLRLPAALFGVLTVYVVYRLGRTVLGPLCGLTTAVVLATSPIHIEYSQEARGYTLLVLALALAAYGALRYGQVQNSDAPSPGRSRLWFLALYLIAGLAALYTHSIAVFYLLAINLMVILAWRPLRQLETRQLLHWIIAQLLLVNLWMPWLAKSVVLARSVTLSWIDRESFLEAAAVMMRLYGFDQLSPWVFSLLPVGVALLGAILAARRGHRQIALFVLLFVVLAPLLIWTVSLIKPLFIARTVLASLIGSALGIGLALSLVPQRAVSAVLLALLLAGNLAGTGQYFQSAEKEAWNRVAERLQSEAEENDRVVICGWQGYYSLEYYLRHQDRPGEIVAWFPASETLVALDADFLQAFLSTNIGDRHFDKREFMDQFRHWSLQDWQTDNRPIWLVTAHCGGGEQALIDRLEAEGYQQRTVDSVTDIALSKFTR